MKHGTYHNPLEAAIERGVVSVQEIADATGFSRTKIQDNAKGRRVPNRTDREAYAKAIGIEPQAFEQAWFGDIESLLAQKVQEAKPDENFLEDAVGNLSKPEMKRFVEAIRTIAKVLGPSVEIPNTIAGIRDLFDRAIDVAGSKPADRKK